jgi:hypothetical protein
LAGATSRDDTPISIQGPNRERPPVHRSHTAAGWACR